MSNMNYTVIVEPAGDGSFSVYVPDLPGCTSCGDTYDEAVESIREAIRGHIEVLRDAGEAIPEPQSRAVVVAA